MNDFSRSTFLLITIVIFIIGGCSKQLPNDNSLRVTEYMKSGLPDPSRTWASNDYALAFSVLENLKQTRQYSLPRKGSEKSGVVFNRMLSQDNMVFMEIEEMMDEQKLHHLRNYLRVCENMVGLYTISATGLHYYHRELTEAYLFGLEVSNKMVELNAKIKGTNSFDSTDPVQSVYLSGLFNFLRTQNGASRFTEEDHRLIVEGISKSVNSNKFWYDENIKANIKLAFQLISDSTAVQNYDANYLDKLEDL